MRTGESKVRGGIRALVGFVALAVMAASPALAGTEAQIKIEQAKVQFSAKNYQEALTLLDAAVAEEPDNAEAYHYAGLCQLGLGKPEAAVPLLRKATELKAGDAGAWEDLAWGQVMSGKFGDAIAAADQALAVKPSDEAARLYKAQALMGQGKFGDAVPLLQGLEGSATYGQSALYYEGVSLTHQGKTEQAAGCFERSAAKDPATDLGKKAAANASALKAGGGAEAAKPWSVRFRVLYQYDSNVIPMNVDTPLPSEISHREDSRTVVDLDARWKFIDTAAGNAYVRYLGYANWQYQDSPLDIMFHRGELGGSFDIPAGGAKVRIGAKAYYMAAYLDNDHYLDDWVGSPQVTFIWNRVLRTRLEYEYSGETFDETPVSKDNNRDNNLNTFSIYQHFLLADGKVNTWIGYGYGQASAKGQNYNLADQMGHAGVMARLPRDAVAAVVFRFEERNYPDNSFDRFEHRWYANGSLQAPIYKQLSVYGGVVYTSVDANQKDLEYTRWIYTLGLMAEI